MYLIIRIRKMAKNPGFRSSEAWIVLESATGLPVGIYGSLAETYKGHKTDFAVFSGLMEMDVDDERIKKSLEIARKKNIKISIHTQIYSKKGGIIKNDLLFKNFFV